MRGLRTELLRFYGRRMPYHPGKWHVIHALAPRRTGRGIVEARSLRMDVDLSDPIGEGLYYVGEYERWETRQVLRMVQPGWVVVDAGANVGYYTLLCSRRVGESGRVFAFEPSSPTFQVLERNVAINECRNVRAFQLALSDRCGEAILEGARAGMRRLSANGDTQGEPVSLMDLDTFAAREGLGRLDFMKIDVEGAEVRLLRGARGVLERFRPALMVEVSPGALEALAASAEELEQILSEAGYRLLRIHRFSRRLVPYTGTPADEFMNVFAIPKS